MKILNLYAGLGGNRKSWTPHEITAVEIVPEIAEIYQELFPYDQVIIADVLQFVRVEDLGSYDFIWASPPCVTHSCATSFHVRHVPDLQSIHGLRIFFDYQIKNDYTKYTIENVQPFYKLPKEFQPTVIIGRHRFWSNFHIPKPLEPIADERIHHDMTLHKRTRSLYMRGSRKLLAEYHNFDLKILEGFTKTRKDKVLRNMTHWRIGEYILKCLENQKNLFSYLGAINER